MENWYENEWPYPKETGERFTKLAKEDGFTSKKELEAYKYVDSIILNHIMELGIPNELIKNSVYPGAVIPSKKEEKLNFYETLGLTYILEKALKETKRNYIKIAIALIRVAFISKFYFRKTLDLIWIRRFSISR